MIKINDPQVIHLAIEQKLSTGASYIDALIEYAHEHEIEIETIAEIVKKSSVIKEKIKTEATKLRLIEREKESENDITIKGFFN
jgi:hypothetical protein